MHIRLLVASDQFQIFGDFSFSWHFFINKTNEELDFAIAVVFFEILEVRVFILKGL